VGGEIVGSIERGYLALLGICGADDKSKVEKAVDKIHRLRIFQDENGKTNLSINDVGGGILVVSQFTLYADCRKGNRPSFVNAAAPELAEELYEHFVDCAKGKFDKVEHGVFGAYMQVELVNDGPFTIVLED
jgi:D-tyrosyl-tRNA(Tyr) deacylase